MTENQKEHEWIESIVERYERPLCQYAYSILQNPDAARETVQDTFLRLCKQGRKRVEKRIPAWLFRVCRNRAIDIIRKEKRMSPLTDAHRATLASSERTPDKTAEAHEQQSELLGLLSKLPPNQSEVIRLKFQQSMSYHQIAEVTQLSESNIGYLIHTGIRTLRNQMASL